MGAGSERPIHKGSASATGSTGSTVGSKTDSVGCGCSGGIRQFLIIRDMRRIHKGDEVVSRKWKSVCCQGAAITGSTVLAHHLQAELIEDREVTSTLLPQLGECRVSGQSAGLQLHTQGRVIKEQCGLPVHGLGFDNTHTNARFG
jgi:hypothetical protein